VHSAKGLEFPYVFVAGLEENIFPSGGMLASPADIEEERRLFYVAMTRAKKAVSLSFANTRMRNGKHESNSPSRFIKEIDTKYIANPLKNDSFSGEDSRDFDDFGGFGSRGFGSGRFSRDSNNSSNFGSGRFSGVSGFGANRFGSGSGSSGRFGGNSGGASSGRPGGGSSTANKYGMGGSNPYGSSGSVRYERKPVSTPRPSDTASKIEALRNRPLPPKISDADFVPAPMTDFKVGQRIEHNRFGQGKILEITGSVPDLKAKIAFDHYGDKVLLLKYAKMRLV